MLECEGLFNIDPAAQGAVLSGETIQSLQQMYSKCDGTCDTFRVLSL